METALVLVVAAGCPRPLPDLGSDDTDDTDGSGDAASDVTGSSGSGSSGTGTSPPELGVPVLELGVSPVKRFDFGWAAVTGAAYYRLLESTAPGEPLVPLAEDLVGTSRSLTVPLHLRAEASYALQACDVAGGCAESAPVHVTGSLAEAIGYFKASNAAAQGYFGDGVALSADGSTLVVGAPGESSVATGIDGDQDDRSAPFAGAVYVFVRDPMGQWSQQAYVKASNTDAGDHFGEALALSADGSTLAVGAPREASVATGIDGDQADGAPRAGAVYVLVRDAAGEWSKQAYVKASNTGSDDYFGSSVALSADGSTLAVGAPHEASAATGIDGDQADDSAPDAGAVYVLVRDAADQWSQQAYVKSLDTDPGDWFGRSVALSGDGRTLAVGATYEDGSASGIDGEVDDSASNSGSVHVLGRDGAGQWSHQAYVKASNPDASDFFGWSVALSADGSTLAVGANGEDGSASGIGGDQASDAEPDAGAVYVLGRDGEGQWSHQAYVKASNPEEYDAFGSSVALSSDGHVLAVGAPQEDGNASGIGGDQASGDAPKAGAVYVLVRDGTAQWSQQAYVKASNPGAEDEFGRAVGLSGEADTLAVGADREDGGASGIGGDQTDESTQLAGAVYLY